MPGPVARKSSSPADNVQAAWTATEARVKAKVKERMVAKVTVGTDPNQYASNGETRVRVPEEMIVDSIILRVRKEVRSRHLRRSPKPKPRRRRKGPTRPERLVKVVKRARVKEKERKAPKVAVLLAATTKSDRFCVDTCGSQRNGAPAALEGRIVNTVIIGSCLTLRPLSLLAKAKAKAKGDKVD